MPNSLQDIPVQCRGTVNIGGKDYHYVRLTRTGNLAIAPGRDTRDWDAIDAGALDYTIIAQQEHDQPGFDGHDGPKIAAACPLCHGFTAPTDPATARARLTEQPDPGKAPADMTPAERLEAETEQWKATDTAQFDAQVNEALLDAKRQARESEARAAELQARLDQQEKAALMSTPQELGVTGAADPDQNAGIPPTDPDVVAGATPDIQARSAPLMDPPTPQQVVWGTDPWTNEKVRVGRQAGADETAPYGRKKDGTPRRPGGRRADA